MQTTDRAGLAQPPHAAPPSPLPGGSPRQRLTWLVGAIAAGWSVSALATIAHVAWILLPLLIVAVSAVVRTGRTMVDRLLLSTVVVAGAFVIGGLLFSLWPWGLAPMAVAGCLFTAVVVAGWLGGRRPRLPRGFSASDVVVLGSGLTAFLVAAYPVWRVGRADRFAFAATSEDRAAHFALFDTIHRLGSYPFLHQQAARVSVQTPAEATYPPGSHFLYAIIDSFLRSTGDPGPAIAAFDRYIFLVLAGYAFLILSAVWSARWILAPLAGGWRLLAATGAVAAVLVGGPLAALLESGYDSQVLGTAFVCLTVAIAIRPPASIGDRIVLLGAGVILIGYTYYLFLPLAAIAVLASFVADWRGVRRRWRPLALGAAVVGVALLAPLYLVSQLNLKAQALTDGINVPLPISALVVTTVASLAPLATRSGRRHRRVRTVALLVTTSLAMIGLFGAYQEIKLGRTGYYFNKFMVCYLVVATVCSATVLLLTGARPRVSRPRVVAAVLVCIGFIWFGIDPGADGGLPGAWRRTSLGAWSIGTRSDPTTYATRAELLDITRHRLLGDGTTTLFLVSDSAYLNWRLTFCNAVLNRNGGANMATVNSVLKIPASTSALDQQSLAKTLGAIEDAVSLSPGPVRIVVRDGETAQAIATRTGLHVTVVLL